MKAVLTDTLWCATVCLAVILYERLTSDSVHPTPRAVGATMIMAGWGLRAWCRVLLAEVGISGVVLATTVQPDVYVTSGPYRIHRHPMYVGSLVIFAGLGMVFVNEWHAGVVVALGALPHYVWRATLETAVRGGK